MTTTPTPAPEVEALIERLKNAITDWDGSQEVDGAPLVKPINCGEARAIIAVLEHRDDMASVGVSLMEAMAAIEVRSQAARIKELEAEAAASFREASQLAVALHASWYRDTAPQWELLPDVPGIISQIDNMTAGMGERIQAAEQQLAVERKRSGVLGAEIDHLRRRLYGSARSNEPCLASNEQKAQAQRCPCRGSNDYCPCQNTPDTETRRARQSDERDRLASQVERLRGALEPFALFDTEDWPDSMRLFEDDPVLRMGHLRTARAAYEETEDAGN